jgi:hypothetical protein
MVKKAKPAFNRRFTLRRLFGGSGFHKTPVGASAFVVFCSTTFLRLLETFGFLYRNRKNVVNLKR